MVVPDANSIDLKAQLLSYVQGLSCCVCVIRYTVSDDQEYFSLFLEGQHGLHDPPQSRSQRGAAGCADVKAARRFLAVPHNGKHRTAGRQGRKSRGRRVYAPDVFQCFCHGIAGQLCQSDGYAAHAAADIQQNVYSGVETDLFCLSAEDARIARLQPME